MATVAALVALDPQLTPDGAALVRLMASVAALLAALDFQEAQMPLRIAALGGFGPSQARPQQAPLDGAALVVAMATGAALAALDPQLTPDGAALVRLMASVAALLAALDLQQASGEAILVGRPQLDPP